MLASQVLIRKARLGVSRDSVSQNRRKKKKKKSKPYAENLPITISCCFTAGMHRKGRGKEESLILYSTLRFLDAIVQLLDVTSGSNILTHTTQFYLPLLASTPNPS